MKLSLLAFVFVLSALSAYDAQAAGCDPTLMGGQAFDADADSAVIVPPPSYNTNSSSIMGYDYHQGRFFGHCPYGCRVQADIQGDDTYRIQGGDAGVPIHIHVEFRVVWGSGMFYDCSHCGQETFDMSASLHSSQTIHSSEQVVSASYCDCRGGGTKSLGLDLTVLPDEGFVLSYTLFEQEVVDGAPGEAEATVHFTGVPVSAQLVSCHGVDDAAVSTLPSTWGRLRAAYR